MTYPYVSGEVCDIIIFLLSAIVDMKDDIHKRKFDSPTTMSTGISANALRSVVCPLSFAKILRL